MKASCPAPCNTCAGAARTPLLRQGICRDLLCADTTARRRRRRRRARPLQIIEFYDTDNSNTISYAEFAPMLEDIMKKVYAAKQDQHNDWGVIKDTETGEWWGWPTPRQRVTPRPIAYGERWPAGAGAAKAGLGAGAQKGPRGAKGRACGR